MALVLSDRGRWIEQAIDCASVHQIGAHEAGEGEQTVDGCLRCIGEAQQQKRDEGDGDLDSDGVFGRAEEVLEHCAEKHLHRYLAEFDFRYNNRVALGVNDEVRADHALKGIVGKRLTYRTANH